MACPSINAYLARLGFHSFEGNTGLCAPKCELLRMLAREATTALEIGFNAGHSADTLLRSNKNLELVSFDIGLHDYVKPAAGFIQFLHPGRHQLVLGDSTETLPHYIETHPDKKFDLLFIDGGHDYEVAKADLENCLKLAHSDSVIVMDDTIYVPAWEKDYSKGPTKVWKEFCAAGIIRDDVRITLDSYNGISYGLKTTVELVEDI
jgi:predicted O-methyltransferase YrrM